MINNIENTLKFKYKILECLQNIPQRRTFFRECILNAGKCSILYHIKSGKIFEFEYLFKLGYTKNKLLGFERRMFTLFLSKQYLDAKVDLVIFGV